MAGRDPAGLRSIFASANGDGALMHAILETLSVPGRPVSPTQFHNSVHNAAAGYWTIGHGAHAPATCLGCHDATFAASLLKAATEVVIERAPVLLCVYDVALPPPLFAQRPVQGAFAAAFVLAPETERGTLGRIALEYRAESAPDAEIEPRAPGLAPMARANPAARALRLLEALASARPDRFAAPLLDGSVRIAYQP